MSIIISFNFVLPKSKFLFWQKWARFTYDALSKTVESKLNKILVDTVGSKRMCKKFPLITQAKKHLES